MGVYLLLLVDLLHLAVLLCDDGFLLLDFSGQGLLGVSSARLIAEFATGGRRISIPFVILDFWGLGFSLLSFGHCSYNGRNFTLSSAQSGLLPVEFLNSRNICWLCECSLIITEALLRSLWGWISTFKTV